MATETLRVYKQGSATYTDITSASVGGFSELTKTDVLNEPGSLEFTLRGTTPAAISAWMDEACTVEYWADGARAAIYTVEEYTPNIDDLSCDVKCVGILAWGAEPGPTYTGDLTGMPAVEAFRALVAQQVADAAGAPSTWLWDDTKVSDLALTSYDGFATTGGPPPSGWTKIGADTGTASVPSAGIMRLVASVSHEAAYSKDGVSILSGYAQFVLKAAIPSGGGVGVIARYQSATSYYLFEVTSTTAQLFRKTSGGWVQILTTVTGLTIGVGDVIGLIVSGAATALLEGQINGTTVISSADTNIPTAGGVGVRASNSATATDIGHFAALSSADAGLARKTVYPGASSGTALTDLIKSISERCGLAVWIDGAYKFNARVTPLITGTPSVTYAYNSTLRGFETTYTARDVVNRLIIVGATATYTNSNAASIAAYGVRAKTLTLPFITTANAALFYSDAYFYYYAQPRRTMRLRAAHDATMRPALLVEVTGLGDSRTYKDVIQQITYRLGDLDDEIVTGPPVVVLRDTM